MSVNPEDLSVTIPWNGEAPFSDNFFYVDKHGFNHQITIRAETGATLLRNVEAAVENLLKRDALPRARGQQPPPNAPETQQASSGAAQSSAPTVPTPPVAQHPDGPLTFEAESLVGSTSQGKTYWKVQGGQFKKFGVTVWPEVLTAAGFNMELLNPAENYNLLGYTATYLLNAEKSTVDKVVPDKVVKLTR